MQEDDKLLLLLRRLLDIYNHEKAPHVRTKVSFILAEFASIPKFDSQVNHLGQELGNIK